MLHRRLKPWPHFISFPLSSRVKNKEKNRQAEIKLRKATSPSWHKFLSHLLLLLRRLMISGGGNPIRGGAGEPAGCWGIAEARASRWNELRTGTVFNVTHIRKTAYSAHVAPDTRKCIPCSRECFKAHRDPSKAGVSNGGQSHVGESEAREGGWDPHIVGCVVLTSLSRKWLQDQ